jgi:hypothetical protein
VTNGILVVQSKPSSPDELDEFHRWYDEVHFPEILAVEGFRSARRYQAADGESYLAVYEVDDVDEAKAAMAEAGAAGRMTRPTGVQLDPPPTTQWFEERATGGA